MGEYKNRELSLNDYYIDEEGVKYSLNGTWTINETQHTEETVGVNAISPFLVSYEYDANEFFFVRQNQSVFIIITTMV